MHTLIVKQWNCMMIIISEFQLISVKKYQLTVINLITGDVHDSNTFI